MKGLGERIRMLRKSRGLTLAAVSKKTDIDQATLSRIENGQMTGTLQSHAKIADVLSIRLPELYENLTANNSEGTTRAKHTDTFLHAKGTVSELLAGTSHLMHTRLMPVRLRIRPQGRTATEEYPKPAERFIYVLKGTLEVRLGKGSRTLKMGESWLFSASIPHHFKNRWDKETWVLSVMTPASL
ncbi:MAG: helix-turn-helix transcriptional regulator [Candidatus Omnitrophica bacterium]|nr:helix-turn-helix transcriptional regulator [Candidatus Omnitrophota bacterium]MBI2174866.1 helix-turn-helix transcriptional regulator [Candidatus Omnitrophota bacterium]MBI3009499.1 helix-turn-helix transcriptional regulator [Candidatus Omnitrophota bacterium]